MKNYNEANEMIQSGHNLRETAGKLDIPYETLRRVAARENWKVKTETVQQLVSLEKAAIGKVLKDIDQIPIDQRCDVLVKLAEAINKVSEAEKE